MGLDDELGCSGLKTYTTLDADDSVTHVGIAADGVAGTNLLNLLDGFDLVIKLLAIDGNNLALVKGNLQQRLVLLGGDMFQIGFFGPEWGQAVHHHR